MTAINPPSQSTAHSPSSRTTRAVWIGRILTALGVIFLSFDIVVKLLQSAVAVQGTVQLGYSASVIRPLGILQLVLLILFLVPRTALLGAVLWTGYLGGAVATHVRVGNPLLTHVLFPVYVAALLWGGLWLRDRRTHVMLAP